MMQMNVKEVKDQSVSVATVAPLNYQWVPEHQTAMVAMENGIYTEMLKWKQ